MDQWRLIDDTPADGGRNMSVDVAILEAVIAQDAPPTIRFYSWSPYCLSLGYGQHAREVDAARMAAYGFDLIRRPTGGRAVFHADEFTYSLALPPDHLLSAGNIADSYHRISAFLLTALGTIGITARAEPANRESISTTLAPICFEITSDYEIAVEGRKLVGSAQMRRRGGLLQHGSLPLTGDIAEICDLLVYENEADREAEVQAVRNHAVTLEEALGGHVPNRSVIADAFINAIEANFGVQLIAGSLTETESTRADELNASTYGNQEWTFRR